MKKLLFLFLLIILPVFFAYSQDDKGSPKRNSQPVKIILQEVTCKDCQGVGWLYALDYFSVSVAKANPGNGAGTSKPSSIAGLKKMVCPYCGGTKTVFREYKVY
jgi:DnaJ-class molecular chaperone